jgi:hypothetical protein
VLHAPSSWPHQITVLRCVPFYAKFYYSLRPILLFANMDVSTTKMCLDTSTLAKGIMGRREYIFKDFIPVISYYLLLNMEQMD